MYLLIYDTGWACPLHCMLHCSCGKDVDWNLGAYGFAYCQLVLATFKIDAVLLFSTPGGCLRGVHSQSHPSRQGHMGCDEYEMEASYCGRLAAFCSRQELNFWNKIVQPLESRRIGV